MKKIITLLMVFIGFTFAEDKFLPNGINPEMQEINTTWGLILFFMWPVLIFGAYKFIEYTLRKTGEDI